MPIEFKLKPGVALMAALSAAYPLSGQAAGAARVDFASGDVKALAPDGRSRSLDKGAEIASGETIDTGNGRAQVRFSDGAQVSLQPQTQFRIDDYRFNGKPDGSEKGFFSLLRGGLRTITGLVGRSNRENYKVTTSVATIGIRGTEYSVSYGNSINVTTGEGSVEVCNAAGCLILNSGETAYVPDNNTQPVMSDKKTELPPPPARDPIAELIAGDNNNGNGPPSLFPVLPSGPGYSLAIAGQADGSEGAVHMGWSGSLANFDGSGSLVSYDSGEGHTVAAGVTVGALSDGIIGWGRWSSGTYNPGWPYNIQSVHYVTGIPTPDADLSSLQLGSMVGTYSLIGFTYPTAWDGSTMTVGTHPISGNLTADFGMGSVSGNLNVPMGVHTYTSNWSGSISGSTFTGSGSVSGGTCSFCSSNTWGFFAGPNAARAGLTYNFYNTDYGTISGAAAFKQTGLAPAPY